MSHSNSSLNCFASCMQKYNQNYILHNQPATISPHLTFGTMAHEVLYNAGKLRDDSDDGVINPDDYYKVIPSEVLYHELKSAFNINSWDLYFKAAIKQVVQYEKECCKELSDYDKTSGIGDGSYEIERELKLQLTVDQLKQLGEYGIDQPFVGIIDLLIHSKTSAIILDYKFSSARKSQEDFDNNSQLPLYALFVHILYDIPLQNIQYGYIDIPKQMFEMPALLKNGTLSRSKSQNCSAEMYKAAVEAVHGDDPYYNCNAGGYYEEAYNSFALNKAAYLSKQYLDFEIYEHIIRELFDTAKTIDMFKAKNLPFLRKFDSYSCKGCEYKNTCKPWLAQVWSEEV